NFLFLGLLWWFVSLVWSLKPTVTTPMLIWLALAVVISIGVWRATRPIRLLPSSRVTIANEGFLAMHELYGQLRTTHQEGARLAGRTFSIVRHWAVCPTCSADVDLAEGGRAFPDRIVGRCSDAPLEHVFSFHPVLLVGHPLRSGCVPK